MVATLTYKVAVLTFKDLNFLQMQLFLVTVRNTLMQNILQKAIPPQKQI